VGTKNGDKLFHGTTGNPQQSLEQEEFAMNNNGRRRNSTHSQNSINKSKSINSIRKGISKVDLSSNKIHHIFDNKIHNINEFLKSYNNNYKSALRAIHKKLLNTLPLSTMKEGDKFEKEININHFVLVVRGRIIKNEVRISTVFSKKKGK